MGLRQAQKTNRDKRIVESAASLFREHGYEGAKIEVMAEHAGVSVGTIYNYYQNKGDLLVAVVSLEVNEVVAAGEKLVHNPPNDPVAAVNALTAIYLRHSLYYLSKEMWRAALSITTANPASPAGLAYTALDEKIAQQMCRLVTKLVASGAIVSDIDAQLVGRLLFNNMNMMFIEFVKDEEADLGAVIAAVEQQSTVVTRMLAARPVEAAMSSRAR